MTTRHRFHQFYAHLRRNISAGGCETSWLVAYLCGHGARDKTDVRCMSAAARAWDSMHPITSREYLRMRERQFQIERVSALPENIACAS